MMEEGTTMTQFADDTIEQIRKDRSAHYEPYG
jgi:hypothetical protein